MFRDKAIASQIKGAHTVEGVQIEPTLRLALPKPEVVGVLGGTSGDGHIVCLRDNFLTSTPLSTSTTVSQPVGLAIESDVIGDVEPRELPRVLIVQPWVGCLQLLAFRGDKLLENSIFVAKTVTRLVA